MSDEDFTVTGYDESKRICRNFIDTTDTRILSFLRKIALTAVYLARNNVQMNQSIVTGQLLASIDILNEDPGGKWVEVGSNVFWSYFVEYGRGEVRPISATVLHWVDPTTGKDVFAKFAGPAEPQPFMEPAVYEAQSKTWDIFVENETKNMREITNV